MNAFAYRLAERIRRDEPIPFPLAALLTSATPLVRLGMWVRLHERRVRVNARVISFGNITAGGTGKTPAVIERARLELAAGHRVAVLTRGYGTRHEKTPIAFDTAQSEQDLYRILGDEPALIARKAPGVVIVKCADRVAAARLAIDSYGADMVILDDGFQYVRLGRDENIAVIDATNPFGNGSLIPQGILREPIQALRRATSIILTRCDQANRLHGALAVLDEVCPGTPIRRTRHAPKDLMRIADGARLPLGFLRGKRVKAICGIANPDAFFRTLETIGADVVERLALPDHCEIPPSKLCGSDIIVMTEKDAARLSAKTEQVYALSVELEDYDAESL